MVSDGAGGRYKKGILGVRHVTGDGSQGGLNGFRGGGGIRWRHGIGCGEDNRELMGYRQ